jgi:hypothetical protein
MQKSSSWEANGCSDSQDIPCILWTSHVQCHVHKSQPLVPILDQMSSVQTIPSYFFKIHLNIILPSMSTFSKQSPSFRFCNQNCMHFSSLTHSVQYN